MIDFDKGRRRLVDAAAGMVGAGLMLPGRTLELFGPLKDTAKKKKGGRRGRRHTAVPGGRGDLRGLQAGARRGADRARRAGRAVQLRERSEI